MSLRELDEILRRIYQQVGRLAESELRQLLPQLVAAHRELEVALIKAVRAGGSGTFTAHQQRMALLKVRKALEAIEDFAPKLAATMGDIARRTGALATRNVEREVAQLSGHYGVPEMLDLDEVVAWNKIKPLYAQYPKSARRYAAGAGKVVREELTMSRIQGLGVDDVVKRLQKRLPVRLAAERSKLERLVRTETMNAYNAGHRGQLLELGEDEENPMLMRWDASHDNRLCTLCQSLDGETIPADDDARFKAKVKAPKSSKKATKMLKFTRPPAHPSCRCVLTAWRDEWGDAKRDAKKYADAGKIKQREWNKRREAHKQSGRTADAKRER